MNKLLANLIPFNKVPVKDISKKQLKNSSANKLQHANSLRNIQI